MYCILFLKKTSGLTTIINTVSSNCKLKLENERGGRLNADLQFNKRNCKLERARRSNSSVAMDLISRPCNKWMYQWMHQRIAIPQ